MTHTVEVETELQSYLLVRGLVEQRKAESDMNQDTAVTAIDELLAQLEGTPAHDVLVSD